ncbi:MAG: hypothetical protein MI725_10415 [Pirellulales bacterium]|nr:hypothetical protein [Pirellulales bacterium]
MIQSKHFSKLKFFGTLVLATAIVFNSFVKDCMALDFGPAVNLGAGINSSAFEGHPRLSADGLRLFFNSDRTGGQGGRDLWLAERASLTSPFATPINLGNTINSSGTEFTASESFDGLTLYFDSGGILQKATRNNLSTPWTDSSITVSTAEFATVNTGPGTLIHPEVSQDGLTLVYQNTIGIVADLVLSTRSSVSDPWGAPTVLTNINTPPPASGSNAWDFHPTFSPDELSLFFSSSRPGGMGAVDLYRAIRSSTAVAWTDGSVQIEAITDLNTSSGEASPFLFGNTLWFHSNRPGGFGAQDIFVAQLIPEPGSMALALGSVAVALFGCRSCRRRS